MDGMATPFPDLTLLRRACAPCTLRQFCLHSGAAEVPAAGLAGRVQPLARGESLFRAGDSGEVVYAVRAGALKTVTVTEDGTEHVLGFHLPGELVGLDALASGRHGVEAVALADSHVCAMPIQSLLATGSRAPDLGRELLQVFGRTALHCHAHVDVLMRRQAGERIALFLHEMGARLLREGAAGAMQLPMSREDIARYLGLALETVSRGFTKLQDEGVLEVSGRVVRVLDVERLRRLAQLPESGDDREPPLERQA